MISSSKQRPPLPAWVIFDNPVWSWYFPAQVKLLKQLLLALRRKASQPTNQQKPLPVQDPSKTMPWLKRFWVIGHSLSPESISTLTSQTRTSPPSRHCCRVRQLVFLLTVWFYSHFILWVGGMAGPLFLPTAVLWAWLDICSSWTYLPCLNAPLFWVVVLRLTLCEPGVHRKKRPKWPGALQEAHCELSTWAELEYPCFSGWGLT